LNTSPKWPEEACLHFAENMYNLLLWRLDTTLQGVVWNQPTPA